MDVIERLRAAVKASGIKQNHIARLAGIEPPKLSKILKGRQVPTVPEFIAIAAAIDLDPARLFSSGELVVEVEGLRAAHAAAKAAEEILASYLPEITPSEKSSSSSSQSAPIAFPKPKQRRTGPTIDAAANPNVELIEQSESTEKRIPRRAWNRGARLIGRAIGDSMTGPGGIADRELVFLRPTRSARTANGHIAVCRVNDGIYLKKLELIGKKIRLVSINPDYPPMEIDSTSDLQVIGYVVDQSSL